MAQRQRRNTPPVTTKDPDGRRRTVIVAKRCCDSCGHEVGDVNDTEIDYILAGRPLPDVRDECPWCAAFLPEEAANA